MLDLFWDKLACMSASLPKEINKNLLYKTYQPNVKYDVTANVLIWKVTPEELVHRTKF